MNTNRRDFLKGAALAAGVGVLSGCATQSGGFCSGLAGAPMRNFRCAPMKKVRVGIVGVGYRGVGAVGRMPMIPGLEVTAVCDARQKCIDRAVDMIFKATGRKPRAYGPAEDAWKALCDSDDVDVVYNCTPWHLHAPVSLYAMRAGKHTMIEVPSAMTIDECWEFVETAEKTRRHCMQLENCCYGEEPLLALNLCSLGMLGEILYGECAYVHDRRWQIFNDDQWNHWRRDMNLVHAGNQYQTHGLGPIAMNMGINRGDRFDYLVSMDTMQRGYETFAAHTLPAGDPRRKLRFAMADMNMSLIHTAMGRTIMLQHDVSTPRPGTRINLTAGTKGMIRSYPKLELHIEPADSWPTEPGMPSFDDKVAAEVRAKYMHNLWKKFGTIAQSVGGHGGKDYMMDLRWTYCLMQGLPLDTDVYDLASWSAVAEATERSSRNRSQAVDIPDFTRGAWREKTDINLVHADIDLAKLDFDSVKIRKAEGQLPHSMKEIKKL